MFFLASEEQKQIRVLIGIVLILGISYLIFAPSKVLLQNAVVLGENQISVAYDQNELKTVSVKQTGKTTPDRVIINQSSFDDLLCCPGIGKKKANSIIEERQRKPFYDWRDFQDRIKGISPIQIEILKDAGVKINAGI